MSIATELEVKRNVGLARRRAPFFARLKRRIDASWQGMSLPRQFLILAMLTLVFFAFLDELFQTRTIEQAFRESSAETASIYISNIVAPLVKDHVGDMQTSAKEQARLDRAIADAGLKQVLERIKIWRLDGTIIYSTVPELVGRRFAIAELARAASGEIVVAQSDPRRDQDRLGAVSRIPMLEIHVPIRDKDGTVIAVGEVHKDVSQLEKKQSNVLYGMWIARFLSLIAGGGILFYLIARAHQTIMQQRRQLQMQFNDATRMAQYNEELRASADDLRKSAARSNEELLSRVGAEIHDGPIQLLSVAMLGMNGQVEQQIAHAAAGRRAPPPPTALVSDVISQLRTISTGLILPELSELMPSDVILLAVTQHEKMTGSTVDARIEELPPVSQGLKACMFRIVQECLNNSQRHAEGKGLKVEANVVDNSIVISVSDQGPGLRLVQADDTRPRLGLLGVRNRVESFGGELTVTETASGGMVVTACLPVDDEA